jgi:hypothetical protein
MDAGEAESQDPYQQIPKRFLDGCMGDPIEAARRWRITYDWR